MISRVDFVPEEFKAFAYSEPDVSIPIENGMTVPGREVTRIMTELLDAHPGQKVLVIGTGSGYQTAYVAEQTGAHVDSLDIRPISGLHEKMLSTVRLFAMDGLRATPEGEKYDAILATCGVPGPVRVWMEALNDGGRLVAPVGTRTEHALRKYVKVGDGLSDMGDFAYCRFFEAEVLLPSGKSVSIFDLGRVAG